MTVLLAHDETFDDDVLLGVYENNKEADKAIERHKQHDVWKNVEFTKIEAKIGQDLRLYYDTPRS